MGIGDELVMLADYTGQRTLARLEGLTDDEFRWQPTPNAWTVRQLQSGRAVVDNNEYQLPPQPLTSIAWRVAHLIEVYGSPRNSRWLRITEPPTPPFASTPWTIAWTSDESLEMLRRALEHFCGLVKMIDDETWEERLGHGTEPYQDATLAGFALHQIDEAIHHGAEIGVLRDLYLWQHADAAALAEPTTVGGAAAAGRWDLVESLTLAGHDVNGEAPSALHLAAALGDLEIVQLLVAHGADLKAKDPVYNGSASLWANFFGRSAVVEYLRSQRA
jgi:hypothetical protein